MLKILRHKQGIFTLNQVFNSLRIEEHHRNCINKADESHVKANLVENSKNPTSSSKQFKTQGNKFKKNFHRHRKNFQPKNNYTKNKKGKEKNEQGHVMYVEEPTILLDIATTKRLSTILRTNFKRIE